MIDTLKKNEEKIVLAFMVCCLLISAGIAFVFEGTRDSGDSVTHYLMSANSWKHPELLLNHWGKPVFTLLSSPFSQAGFAGIKFFNVLLSFGSTALIYYSAKRAGFAFAWAIPVFTYFAPFFFLSQFSGLTEPLFAFVLCLAIWMTLNDRKGLALVVISFLPFVRSEGMMVLGAWGLYLLLTSNWKWIPLLGTGNFIYGFAGMFYYGTPLWYFSENPYAVEASNYGSGTWSHFPEKYFNIAGIPIAILTLLGLLVWLSSFANKSLSASGVKMTERRMLVYGSFLFYFVSHVIFWRFGLYHSMGLERVMVAILPLGAWVAAEGIEKIFWLANWVNGKAATAITMIFILYVALFPFTPNPSAMKLPRDLEYQLDQQAIEEMKNWLQENSLVGKVIFSAHPSVALQLGLDPFDENQFIRLDKLSSGAGKSGQLVVWDNWFAPLETAMPKSFLEKSPERYELLKCFVKENPKKKGEICLYRIK